MQFASDIFKKVSDYLNGHITLEKLEDWLAPNLGLFLSLPPNNASELAATIELGLAEISKGHRTEEEFRTLLRESITSHDFVFVPPIASQPFHTSSIGTTFEVEWVAIVPIQEQHPEWQYVDIELEKASL